MKRNQKQTEKDITPILRRIQEKQKIAHMRYLNKIKLIRNGQLRIDDLRQNPEYQKASSGIGKGTNDQIRMEFGTQTDVLHRQVQQRDWKLRSNVQGDGHIGRFTGQKDFRKK